MRNFAVIAMCALAAFAAAQDRPRGLALIGHSGTTQSIVREHSEHIFRTGDLAPFLEFAEKRGLRVEQKDGFYIAVELESLIPYRKLIEAQLVKAVFTSPGFALELNSLSPAQRAVMAEMYGHEPETLERVKAGTGHLAIYPQLNLYVESPAGSNSLRVAINIEPVVPDTPPSAGTPFEPTAKLTDRWWVYEVREMFPSRNPSESHAVYMELLQQVIYELDQEAVEILTSVSQIMEELAHASFQNSRRSLSDLRAGQPLPGSFQEMFSGPQGRVEPADDPGVIRAQEYMRAQMESAQTGTLTRAAFTFTFAVQPGMYRIESGFVSIPLPLRD